MAKKENPKARLGKILFDQPEFKDLNDLYLLLARDENVVIADCDPDKGKPVVELTSMESEILFRFKKTGEGSYELKVVK